jgi:hypothetical protein
MTPDWSEKPQPVPYADFNDPQTLNLYGYVRNNPLSKMDPDGHRFIDWLLNKLQPLPPPPPPPPPAPPVDHQLVLASLVDQKPAGTKMTVNQMAKVLHNESNGLTGGQPGQLEKGKTAEANAILNNAQQTKPNQMAPATGTPTSQDLKIMEQVYYDRATGVPDPVAGRTYFGNSAQELTSRPVGSGRQTVYSHFGPFDWGSNAPQYIYIYNNPGK